MNPELIDQIKPVHRQISPERKTQKCERQIENPMRDTAKPTLAHRDAQIKFIRRMMYDVKIPEKPRFVADAMKPVIAKIIGKKQNQPRPPSVHRHLKRCIFINPNICQTIKQSEDQPETDAPETERDIRPGIFTI